MAILSARELPATRPLPILIQQRTRPQPEARWEQLILRLGFIATGVFSFNMALQAWQQGQIETHREVLWAVFAEYALAFTLLTAGMLPGAVLKRLSLLIPAALVLVLVVWFYVKIEIALTIYGTDNLAFSQIAAERLRHGQNPFSVHDPSVIQTAADRFGVPRTFLTSTTDGRPLSNLMSWPAGSVLVFVPAVFLGVGDMRWVVVAFEIAVLAALWLRASAALRPLIVIPLAVDPDLFLQFTGGGVVDFVWVLPVLASAIALYGRRYGWAALLYGLAAGTKQQPWLLAPFLVIWIWHMHGKLPLRARGRAVAEFGAIAAAGFLVLNVPFMVWDFGGWYRGVMLPFNAQLVPFGSGISLLTQTGAAELSKDFYSAATFGVWGVLLLAYALHFRTLKHAVWLAPAIIMWFGYRSLQNYFIYWTPMMLVALMAWWEEEGRAAAAAADV